MDKTELKQLIRECLDEILKETEFTSNMPDPKRTTDITDIISARRGAVGEKITTKEKIPLKDGPYDALRYGYTLEIGGVKFSTDVGVRCPREYCGGPQPIIVRDGVAYIPPKNPAPSNL